MIYFLDASALVKRYVLEPGTDEVRALIRKRRRLAASSVSSVEVPSALWRRARKGDLSREQAERHADQAALDLAAMDVVQVRAPVLALAADLVARHPLRAYDAIQLASALRLAREAGLSLTFACADAALAEAAEAEKVRALRVG